MEPPGVRITSTGSSPGIIVLSFTDAKPVARTLIWVGPGRTPASTNEPSDPERVSTLTPPRNMSNPPVAISASAMGPPALDRTRPRMASPCSSVMSPRSTAAPPGTSTSTRRPAKRGARTPSV